ncbi:hypothetical protein BURK1_03392 [Burkholderiales bacterium]|nr:hypothetical protein BURK1_03392 [Burkholderiales bacterium]
MRHRRTDVVVIGAGPAGLGAALALGERAIVLDEAGEVGGLAHAIDVGGASFDLGGHSFHTPHRAVRDLVYGALPMEERPRDAWCLVGGDYVPYPFQKHFDRLSDAAVVAACRDGLASARDTARAGDFDAYLDARFGAGIASAFMKPYNRKLWGDDLARMSASWAAERVAAPAGVHERFATDGGRRTPLQDDTVVAYPARGGYGEIFVALARRVARLELGKAVAAIDPGARTCTTRDGSLYAWDELVSTMPLTRLVHCVAGAPASLKASVGRLEALPVTLAMVAIDGPLATPRQRVYSSDDALPGHKLVLNANSSAWLASRERQGIQLEISGPALARCGGGDLKVRVVEALAECGVIDRPGRVAEARTLTLPLGYPVPTHSRPAIVAEAKRWLRAHGIHTLGRFGEWDYINADEALHRGLAWRGGPPEATAS